MDKKKAFTLIELLVVISIIVILLGILIPVLGRAREFGRRTKCLSNLKQLQLAWIIYAEQNDDMIVNGDVWDGKSGTNSNTNPSWVGNDIEILHTRLSLDIQSQAIKVGTLYPYIKSEKPYRCPNGFRRFIRTYSIAISMNAIEAGLMRSFYSETNKVGNTVLRIENRMDIINPHPSSRMVFVDKGMPSGGYSVHYAEELWGSPPTCRHINGNTFSFVDGHAEFWKWEGKETIKSGLSLDPDRIIETAHETFKPTTNEGLKDLHKTQIAVWGRLGYEPTPTD
jgi:prepilin-type N-terminal cleavage/methylation domain-containing protein/prepilin-type processing-associated H-X9-DG protein